MFVGGALLDLISAATNIEMNKRKRRPYEERTDVASKATHLRRIEETGKMTGYAFESTT